MIFDIITLFIVTAMTPVVLFINGLLSVIPEIPTLPITLFFSNLSALDTIFPVTEVILFASLALTFKLSIAYYRLTMLSLFLGKKIITTIFTLRS